MTIVTIEKLKQHGKYIEYSELRKAYIYVMGVKRYAWNGDGVNQI